MKLTYLCVCVCVSWHRTKKIHQLDTSRVSHSERTLGAKSMRKFTIIGY